MGYKRIYSLFLSLVMLCCICYIKPVHAEEGVPSLNLNAKSAILMEPLTGKILLEQNSHEKLAPASVTKVMTILLIYESIAQGKINWDDTVTISAHAAGMGGSQIFLEPMEQQSVRDLTKSIVIASANDAAVAMAEYIAGSEEGFVVMMNKRAKELGMNDTNFINACGLDADGHYTSAYDIALMSSELINKHPGVYEYTKVWMDKITHRTARGDSDFGLTNTNRLIRSYTGATGLKTGSTGNALYCMSATAYRDNLNLVAVVMGSPDRDTRFYEAMKMLDYGFANYAISLGDEAGTEKGLIKVFKGEKEEVAVVVKNQINLLSSKNKNVSMESKVELLDALNAPVVKGTKAGEIIYFFEGREVGRSDLIAVEAVNKASLRDNVERMYGKWFE